MRSRLLVRVRVICSVFVAIAVLLILRLYFVQIVHGQEYARSAMGQYVEPSPDTQSRGNIYFTTKDGALVAAAVMQSGWRIAITPKDITDPASAYAKLNAITPIDQERFITSASKKDDPYEEVAFRVDDAAATKIRALKIPGVLLVRDQWRAYPGGDLAAQAVGFVGYKGDTKVGVYGLEREWNDTLTETTSGLYVNPFAEIFTNVTAMVSSDPAAHQGDIVTSIEPNVQAQLEKTLDTVMRDYTPRLAGGIVMDPHTGEIVAIANRPAFDPNTYNTVSDPSVYADALVEGRYELGSIMKPLTMATGIDTGAVTPATKYDDTGCLERSGKTICNYDHKARGVVPMQEVLNQSLNVGATFVADQTGHVQFTKYMKALGFGEKTGVDLPNEVAGDLSPLGDGKGPDVNYAAASFGQGVSISPIEMIRALATLANGGKLPNPHVVTGIRYESGITRTIDATSGPQVYKPQTVDTVTNMLTTVYDDALLKGALKQEHHTIAAKTGTAQIAIPGGGYYTDRYLHSFFGYFPAHDPKFIVFLFAVEPHGQEFASATLARPFLDVAQYLINYYDIPPDR
ncbi:MAG: penicillin-binding protein 2 [Candidatus Kaiserbacteria bacterium]|nr:penicillin-binding protein 2 [Candidatus Kaiserbacteria bacterium]